MLDRTGGEDVVLAARHTAQHFKVEIQDAGGSWVDYSDYIDVDRRDRLEVSIDNKFLRTFTFQIAREIVDDDEAVVSLSPLISSDIQLGRGIRIYGARTALGATPSGSDWKFECDGKIDRWDAAQDPMTLTGRDVSGVLEDRKVEDETVYSENSDTPVQDVIQAVIDDWADGMFTLVVDGDSPLLDTPGLVRAYKIEAGTSVREAIFQLAEKAGGHVIEYRMQQDGSGFELLLYRPDREATSPVWTFGPDDYYTVNRLDAELTNVRNVWQLSYLDEGTGKRQLVEQVDDASVTDYGRLWARIVEADDSQISTEEEALAMLAAAAADTSRPDADHAIECDYFWPAQMGDLIRHSPNTVHYLANQDFAVVGLRHVWEKGSGTTIVQTRGKPSGRPFSWRQKSTKKPAREGERAILNFREIGRTPTTVTYGWTLGPGLDESWIHDYTELQPYADDRWPGESRLPDAILDDRDATYTFDIPEQGYLRYVQVEGRVISEPDAAAVERALIFPSNIQADFIAFLAVKVNQTDGSVEIRGWSTDRARSVAYAWNVGPADRAAPTVTDAENQGGGADGGGLITGFTSDFYATLPAETVDYGETIKVTAVAYINADGTGADGSNTDHGPPVGAQDERIKITNPNGIGDGIVISQKLREGTRSWLSSVEFSATDWNTVAWTSGTVTMQGAGTYSIASGNTGNLANDNVHYIYLDKNVSLTVLQVSDDPDSIAGEDVILFGVAWRAPATNQEASFIPRNSFLGIGETEIGDNSISTGKIQALAITTDLLDAGAVTAAKITVSLLSAITVETGDLVAGRLMNAPIASSPTAGIRIGNTGTYSIPGSWVRYIDLAASGSNPFIYHSALVLNADGSATFGGTVTASSFTAGSPTFDGSIFVKAGSGNNRVVLNAASGDGQVIVYDASDNSCGVIQGTGTYLEITPISGLRIRGPLNFFATGAPIGRQTVGGSRADPEQALKDLLSKLNSYGLINDTTSS